MTSTSWYHVLVVVKLQSSSNSYAFPMVEGAEWTLLDASRTITLQFSQK